MSSGCKLESRPTIPVPSLKPLPAWIPEPMDVHHSTRKLLTRLGRVELLVIDEMGYLDLRPEQSDMFFKQMEERYRNRTSAIITTNLEYEEWAAFLGQKAMVAAILHRLRHRCVTIRVDGVSLRGPVS